MLAAAGTFVVTALSVNGAARADVLVRLANGGQYRTTHAWEEGGLVKLYVRGGVIGLPRERVAAIVDTRSEAAEDRARAVDTAPPGALDAERPTSNAERETLAPAENPEAPSPQARGAREDPAAQERELDERAARAQHDLVEARDRGEPQATLDVLQARVDEVTRQRAALHDRPRAGR